MLKSFLVRGVAALGLLAATSCATVADQGSFTPGAGPAMWEVSDEDTTVALFGTIHLLPENSSWRTPRFEQALVNSQALVIETVIDDKNPQALAQEMAALGFSPGLPPILDRVPAEKRAALQAAITKTGIPMPLFDRMESWAAAFTLLGVQFEALGLKADQGVESVLKARFAKDGKPIQQLETNREQLSLFDSLPEDAQRLLLAGAVESSDSVRAQFSAMLDAWLKGDVGSIARTFNEDLQESPELKAALLTRRNANWAEWIDRRMKSPGSALVAVGAGHLAGDVSVQRYLESKGYKVRRVQ